MACFLCLPVAGFLWVGVAGLIEALASPVHGIRGPSLSGGAHLALLSCLPCGRLSPGCRPGLIEASKRGCYEALVLQASAFPGRHPLSRHKPGYGLSLAIADLETAIALLRRPAVPLSCSWADTGGAPDRAPLDRLPAVPCLALPGHAQPRQASPRLASPCHAMPCLGVSGVSIVSRFPPRRPLRRCCCFCLCCLCRDVLVFPGFLHHRLGCSV